VRARNAARRYPAPSPTLVAVAALAAALTTPGTTQAQGDDWSITRERRPPRRPRSEPRPPRTRRAPPNREDAASSRFDVLTTRYLAALRREPTDRFAFERLLELHRREHGGLDVLEGELDAAVTADGDDYAALVVLGRLLEARGRPDEARDRFARARDLKPSQPGPRVALGRLARARGDDQAARDALTAALERTPSGAAREQLVRELAEVELDLGDVEAARERYASLARGPGASVYLRTELARALEARGRHEEAAAEYARVARALRGDARAQGPVLRDQGRAELAAGDVDAAIATLGRALRLVARSSGLRVEVLDLLVDAHRRGDRLDELVDRLSGSRDADTAAVLGRLYDELQREDEAVAAYKRALRGRPRDLDTRLRLIQLLSRSGRLDDAMREYQALIRAAPREPRFVVELAQLLMQTGRRDEALRLARSTGRKHPRDPVVHRALAELYARWGEDDLAADEIALLARIDPDDPANLVALGAQRLAEGDEQGALAAWRRILRTESDEARAQATLGGVLADHDQLTAAAKAYERAVELAPDELAYVRGLANVRERLHQHRQAIEQWTRVLALAEDDRAARREARARIVAIHARAGSLEREVRLWKRAFAADPPDVDAGRFLAEAHLRARPRRLDDAEAVLARVTALEPGAVESLLALERVRTARGDLEGALEVLSRLVEAHPQRAASYLQRMAEHALALYQDERAVEYAARAVSLSPEDAEGHARLGDLYRARQDTGRAVRSYERALELDPRRFDTAFDLAEVHLSRGELEQADRWLRRLIRAAPDDDLVSRAARAAVQVNLGLGTLRDLEADLLPLAIGHPQRPVFRRALVELYDALAAPLIRDVEAGRDPAAADAREQLASLGTRGIKPLLEALADGDPEQRRIALDVLGYLDHESAAVPLLAAAEGDGSAELRARAVIAAGAVARPDLVPRFAALAEGPERRLRGAGTYGLGRLGSAAARAELRKLLEAPDIVVRAQAALGLGAAGDRRAVGALEERLGTDRSPFVRAAAAWALGRLGVEDAAARLSAAMFEPDALLRLAATDALGRLTGETARTALAAAVFDPDPSLRSMAATALRRPPDGDRGADTLLPIPVGAELGPPYLRRVLDREPPVGLPPPALGPLTEALSSALDEALRGPPERVRAALEALDDRAGEASFALGPLTGGRERWPAEIRAEVDAGARRVVEGAAGGVFEAVDHVDPAIRGRALRVAVLLGGDRAGAVVARGLQDPVARVRRAALEAVAAVAHPTPFAPAVAARLRDDEAWTIRMRAAEVAGRVAESDEVRAALVDALASDPYAFVREAAAKSLRPGMGADARAALEAAAVADPDASVQAAARARLQTIR